MTGANTCERCGAQYDGFHSCAAPRPRDGQRPFSTSSYGTPPASSPGALGALPTTTPVGSTTTGASVGQPYPAEVARGRSSVLLWIGVVMMMVSVAVIAGVVINRMRPPVAVPIVAGSAASPSPRSTGAQASPGAAQNPTSQPSVVPPAAPSAAPADPATPAAPTLPPIDSEPLPDDPALAFRERMLRGASTYHFDMSGSIEAGNEALTIEVSLDVAGRDYGGTMKVKQQRVRVTAELIVKDGVQYTRAPGDTWMRETALPEAMPGELFSSIGQEGWAALQYVGPVRRDGDRLHHLRVPQVDWLSVSSAFLDGERSGVSIRTLGLDVWVTNDGKPRFATLAFDGTVREGAIEIDMTYRFEYRISGFGDPLEIRAPEKFTDPDMPSS